MSINIKQFGAQGNGATDDTSAFEEAIRSIAARKGGRLVLPAGHYRLRPINLTHHLIFYLRAGARLTAIESDWPLIDPLPSYGRGRDHPGPRYSSLLHGEHLVNVTILGQDARRSVIDGQGQHWWENHAKGNETFTRGHLIEFLYSSNIRMYNVTLKNSPFWTNHFYDCDHVHVRNVHVKSPLASANTDGWDPDSSRNVLIEDSTYFGGDDCVAIKSGWDCYGIAYDKPCVNITIRNVTCHGQFAGIAIGSEMSGGVENVTIEHVRFTRANKPVNIKVGNTRGGYVRNIAYRNISVAGKIDQGVHVDAFHFYNNPNPECPKDWRPSTPVTVSNISMIGINGMHAHIQGKDIFHFAGLPDSPLENIYMEDVFFPNTVRNEIAWNCSNVFNAMARNGTVHPWPPCPQFRIVNDDDEAPWLSSKATLCAWFFLMCLILRKR